MSQPYVYKLTHKTTNQYYIGYRCNNKLLPEQDILIYQSSSKKVKEIGFNNFNIEILATFTNKQDAYDYEQKLIYENFDDRNILNKSVFYNQKRFVNSGHSDETKLKMSLSRKGIKKPTSMIEKMRHSKIGKSKLSGRSPNNDKVAITNLQKRIQNFNFQNLPELSNHIKYLSSLGHTNIEISKHLNISQTSVGKYKKMF
jgi:hypothetical protein